jgi:Peptidase family M28
MRRALLAVLILATRPLTAAAQTAAPTDAGAASITAADVARRVGIIADDSMMGRDTPSRGLELTAAYVADQFRSFGLRPAGDSGTFFQRYPITRRRFLAEGSAVTFVSGGATAEARFDRSARYLQGQVSGRPITGPVVLVGGALDSEAVAELPVRDKIVLYPIAVGTDAERTTQAAHALRLAKPSALVLLTDLPEAVFAARIPNTATPRTAVDLKLTAPPVVEVNQAAVASVLRTARIDAGAVRSASKPVYRELPGLRLTVALRDSVLHRLTAPNTVGILEGSDPELRKEFLVFSAHMDHIGITPGVPDSINNGADDDGSGTTGVMELAEAFSRRGARPKRSMIFLTVSGEEKGLWGSRYFSEHPPVPLGQVVADLNIDMIGRNWRDTIVAIGKEHSDLGATLERVNRAHPELHMTAIDDRWPEERFYFRSDHYNFARKGVPILFFFNGVHPDYHQPSDSPDKIDSEKESRILRLLYYLGRAVGDAPARPQWKPESYREIVEEPLHP